MGQVTRGFSRHRLALQVQRCVARLLIQEVRDPRLTRVTVSHVTVTPDGLLAKVYVVVGQGENPSENVKRLNYMAGFLRTHLAKLLAVRAVPALRFYEDAAFETSQRVLTLIHEYAPIKAHVED
jgi:ribosome-binding factor A